MEYMVNIIRNLLNFSLNDYTFIQILILKFVVPCAILKPLCMVLDNFNSNFKGRHFKHIRVLLLTSIVMIFILYFIIFEFIQNI